MIEQHVYVFSRKKRGALTIGPATVRIAGTDLKTRDDRRARRRAAEERALDGGQAGPQPGISAAAAARVAARRRGSVRRRAASTSPRSTSGEQVTASWRLYTQSDILKYRPLAEPKYEDFWSEDLFVPTVAPRLGSRRSSKGSEYEVALLLQEGALPAQGGQAHHHAARGRGDDACRPRSTPAPPTRASRRRSPSRSCRCPSRGGRPGSRRPTSGSYELVVVGRSHGGQGGRGGHLEGDGARRRQHAQRAGCPSSTSSTASSVYEPTTKETIEPGDEIHGEKIYTYLLHAAEGRRAVAAGGRAGLLRSGGGEVRGGQVAADRADRRGRPDQGGVGVADRRRRRTCSGSRCGRSATAPSVRSSVGERLFRGRLGHRHAGAAAGRVAAGARRRCAAAAARRARPPAPSGGARGAARGGACAWPSTTSRRSGRRPSSASARACIYEHLEYRLGAKVEALTLGELRAHLRARGFDKETAEAVVKELENCDFARFAPSASGPGEMRAALRRVRTLLGLDREARQPPEKEVAA